MAAVVGQLEPLPGGLYTGTMGYADIYPQHAGIGGVRTQDRALPAFAEAVTAQTNRAMSIANAPQGLLGTPAGWFVILIVLIVGWSWATTGKLIP